MIARLSKTVAAMEKNLRQVYQMIGNLIDSEPPHPDMMTELSDLSPGAPATTDDPPVAQSILAATDVKIKGKYFLAPRRDRSWRRNYPRMQPDCSST
ncbi:hypothetical protein [Rhodoferax sp.]|uniref:hypothetical protein n=1 Tax=Rhodoferax sp. TaxID=50421 RepID=UPI00262A538F|nr:hypothetical protein [Rhodoferax sp.]